MTIRDRLSEARASLRENLRPDDPRSDLGLEFTAWCTAATSRINSAGTDDDPVCVRAYASEAKGAGLMAVDYATNPRQIQIGESLVSTAEWLKEHAETMPRPSQPHNHIS